ncbi:NEDD4-binding protein 3 [Corvus moneduloides]|uniref:NEDD4 binding protein 3 n=1 Tax=Corvus moneduloides TaxID=1196302 RepID=A0A8C3E5P7_CORMO|nr:NEDD4-binding protein 3 [Corvus moneduloides]XP_031980733.1 NEDD4-binding protein 3 [Corvus moneduloides]
MAAAQGPVTCEPDTRVLGTYLSSEPVGVVGSMGSVGSLVEKQDLSPLELRAPLGGSRGLRQPDGLLRKGPSQRELFGYLHGAKKETRSERKHQVSGACYKRDYESDRENRSPERCSREHHRGADFSKSSLPERGRFDKCRIRPSAFKAVAGKGLVSMQGLSSSKGQKLSKSNGSLHTLLSQSSTAAPQHGPLRTHLLHAISLDEASDSSHNSIQSFPSYGSRLKPAQSQFSASMGHINHIGGSLDRVSRSPRDTLAPEKMPLSCKSMATLSRLQSPGEPPPPYEFSYSLEDAVKQLEDRLQETGGELRQLKRSLSETEDPFTQAFEDKQRLWLDELEDLKQMYMARLQQVMQQAQRGQRALQLQLYKAQQEKKRLQEELSLQQCQCEETKLRQPQGEHSSPKLEETKWEVCQKAAEISLLKQQLRDTQEEMAQKLGEIFSLKTQLREAKAEVQARDSQLAQLADSFQSPPEPSTSLPLGDDPMPSCQDFPGCETDDSKCRGLQSDSAEPLERQVEWLWAELLRERRQGQLQAVNFELERKTWQEEKEKVLRYQRELQASYMEMYHRSQALERELRQLRAEPRDVGIDSPWIERVESSKI